MNPTVIDLVTPHLLRIVSLANEADKGSNVYWHLRDAVGKTMGELGHQYNASALVAAYVDGLETAAGQAAPSRTAYIRVLQDASAAARNLRRD